MLTTAWVATVLGRHTAVHGESGVAEAIADLAAGRRTATLAFGAEITKVDDRTVALTATPVLEGGSADLLLAGTAGAVGGHGWWYLVELDAATVTPIDALDATRGLATVSATGARAVRLPLLSTRQVEAVGAVLLAAEACGVGAWCVDTAAGWARERR